MCYYPKSAELNGPESAFMDSNFAKSRDYCFQCETSYAGYIIYCLAYQNQCRLIAEPLFGETFAITIACWNTNLFTSRQMGLYY